MTWLTLALAAAVTAGGDTDAALADLARVPLDRRPFTYYVTTTPLDSDEARESASIALRLVVPSMSRQPILERCLPQQITPTLYRLDLAELQWPLEEWRKIIAKYPYNPTASKNPLILRADWLLVTLTDEHESGAYYPLTFGKKPATRDEALAILKVDNTPGLRFGLIEGESGISETGVRWIENRPIPRGYAWGTFDVLALDAARDPLARPEAVGKHDGEEWIIGLPKIHLATGTRGALQAYFLANGNGGIVDRAPVDLVDDWTEFRGYREVRTAGSCISCHRSGLNFPTRNELRETLEAGVNLRSLYPQNEQIEAFHLSDVGKQLRRDNEDFAAIVEKACGQAPAAVSARFQSAVVRYDEDVTPARAAHELYLEAEELPLALGWINARGYDVGPRVAALAHGDPIPRESFAERYATVRAFCDQWRATR